MAARAIAAVMDEGRSLDAAMSGLPAVLSGADRGLAAALAYGVLREYRWLDAMLAPRLARPPQPLLKALLLVGLYQLEFMRVPAHAAVHASVAATRDLGLGKARGMVNAILRGHQRSGPAAPPDHPAVRYSHPDWLYKRIREDWPDRWRDVLAANNAQAPMHLRINRRMTTRDAYRTQLADAGIAASVMAENACGLTLENPISASELPGFAEGQVSIQDGAAQLAAALLDARAGERVLDACAAPGNKSAHLLECEDIDLLALDIDTGRLATLAQTLERPHLTARTQVADAADTAAWWGGQPFQRILLDAPCTGTGVIRRHPDIKWLRRAADIAAARRRQLRLLESLWPTLAPGGRLVYATCSILRAEGADIVEAFLASQNDAREVVIAADWGIPEVRGRRIAPGDHGFDGFYYAVIERGS